MDPYQVRSNPQQQSMSYHNNYSHHQQRVANRGHYSNRQQVQQVHESSTSQRASSLQQSKQPAASSRSSSNANRNNSSSNINNISTTTSASSASENDDFHQLSSISTTTNKTNSSQQAIIHSSNKMSHQHQQQLMQQQQHKQRQQQQQQQQHHHHHHHHQQQQQQHHRQAALQAQTLAAPGKNGAGPRASHGASATAAVDNLTTSSSDHTIDDLHHLAHSYGHHHHHRLTAAAAAAGSRYGSSGDASGAGSNAVGSQSGSRFLLGVLFTLAEMLLFATIALWLYWSYQHDDGFAWQNDRKQQFNTHAALMLFGFVFLNGQAMLIYRSFQCCSKIYTKILHTILFVLATSAISLGLILGYTAQENVGANNKPIMHFYSLHAWCGLVTVGLFVFQFVFGFVSFLILLCCDSATSKFRAALLPIHKTFGLIIFSLSVSSCLMGLLQTARSRLSSKLNKVDYHELGEAGIVINMIGVSLICLAILMPYIIRNLDIKRPFRSELDRHLKLSQLEMRT